jgi:hypothetical protein
MSLSKNFLRAAILCWLSIGISSAAEREGHHRDEKPKFPYDPNTTKYCSWWVDNDGSVPCSGILDAWLISLADFMRWVSISQTQD